MVPEVTTEHAMATATLPMTTADLLAIPDDGKRRWLIRGELREQDVTIRNRFHSGTMANIATELNNWRRTLKTPRGQVVCGEAGVRLPGKDDEEDTTLGVDVAYVPPEVMVRQSDDSTIIEGVPSLVVEILSPSDKIEEIDEMIEEYLEAGTPLLWVVSPSWRNVTIYQSGRDATFVNDKQEIDGGDVLPGFRCPVERFFD
jgi:Uma2 family endonuclease